MNRKQKNITVLKYHMFTFVFLLSAIFLLFSLYFQKINYNEYTAKTNAIAGEVISKTIIVTNDNINLYKIYIDVPYEENESKYVNSFTDELINKSMELFGSSIEDSNLRESDFQSTI